MPTTAPEKLPLVEVAAGALVDHEGRVLLTRRADGAHQGGLWEFPGGKCDPGETALDALRRELHEELEVEVVAARPLIRVRHDYPDLRVLLDVWRIDSWRGEPHGHEGQPLAWHLPRDLPVTQMPAADRPVVTALQLPPLCLVTPEPGADRAVFLDHLEQALNAGLRLVQLRAPSLPASDYLDLLKASLAVAARHEALVMADLPSGVEPEEAVEAGAQGVHLGSARLAGVTRRPVAEKVWLSAACHGASELAHAEHLGCDFALLSPVCTTLSHPDTTPLGWQAFSELVGAVNLPVYALGGLLRQDCGLAWEAGGQGVAAIRSLWPGEVDADG